jgi:hypothetical protein
MPAGSFTCSTGDAMTETIPLLMGVFMGLIGVVLGMCFVYFMDGRIQRNINAAKDQDYEQAGS